jgi:hypothetical protein
LLQDYQTIMPECEILDLSVVSAKMAAPDEARIDVEIGRELFEPIFGFFV